MAAPSSSSSFGMAGTDAVPPDPKLEEFIKEVKEIEKRDAVLTSDQQINRLLRPGASYFNLNPFEVLQLDPHTAKPEDYKKAYRKLSILVHPDKNQDDADRAQQAFDIVNSAYKVLEDEKTRKKCLEIVNEAIARTDLNMEEKRKNLKKTLAAKDPELLKSPGALRIEEDDPEKKKHAIYILTMKLFADYERKNRDLAKREQQERKRKREQEIEEEENVKAQKEWEKGFEESRGERVQSWQSFLNSAGSTKKKKKLQGFRPPKHKMESRPS
ncbi:unnamed protein product [Cyprideis torosa]|uniref:Uncharacterized protein n=1 Tax=Cyprideis torosa TaxID=163714 RepID=A0A7R8WB03_9CRUS|nr:unnamed protein product [Cyprideis torosa]CAG0886860.1 unnamed protein product [Cyprideis torosa]